MRLARIWSDLLGIEYVGVADNFLELGASSLTVSRLLVALVREFDVTLPMKAVFECRTLSAFAERVERALRGRRLERSPSSEHVASPETPSAAQKHIWIHCQLTAPDAYNVPVAFELEGELDLLALGGAIDDVIARHGGLRTYLDDRASHTPILKMSRIAAGR